MRRDAFLLPALGMLLLYCSAYVGLIIINLRGSARAGGDPFVLLHFALAALVAVGLHRVAKKGFGRLRILTVPLTLAGLLCAVIPFLPEEALTNFFNARPPLIGMVMALFLPVGLTLFFRAAHAGKEGFSFGLVMVCGEVLWAALFPLLGGVLVRGPVNPLAFHLFSLNFWLCAGAGLCLGAALACGTRDASGLYPSWTQGDDGAQAPPALPPDPAMPGRREKRALLLLIFTAGAGMFMLMGLHMGMLMPKMSLEPKLIALPHIILVALLPLAGRMLDSARPGRFSAWVLPAVALAPLFGLAHAHGLIDLMPLYCLINILQQLLLLAVYTVSARLMKTRAALPLLLILAYCLPLAQIGGLVARSRVESLPYGLFAASLLLAAVTVLCLVRFRRLLAEKPELWALPGAGEAREAGSGRKPPELEKLNALAACYGLSKREKQIAGLLMEGLAGKKIAARLDVRDSTVRTLVQRLKEKTGADSRVTLIERFAAQSPAQAKDAPPGAR